MTYIIVDFEATCCDKGSVARNEMEIIEIGAVVLNGKGPEILDEFQCFIKPVRNPRLSEFCTSLTSIKQGMVDVAEGFPAAMEQFQAWIEGFDKPLFCSWGYYDKSQLMQDCQYHHSQYPFSDEHINIKQRFSNNRGYKKGLGLDQALKSVGLTFCGTAHRGIDDARNMANLSSYIFE
ncbi:exonuclease domain-containing protein [bacterium AH-315-K03]|nr:exonuclease domain-containing protein [bacterium AH-315-K03]